jgi:hypothetical protein
MPYLSLNPSRHFVRAGIVYVTDLNDRPYNFWTKKIPALGGD